MLRFSIPLLLLGLAACTEVPRTFEAEKLDPNSSLLAVPDALGVMVDPVQGAPEAAGPALAGAIAVALQDVEVPASTEASNTRSFHLAGSATPVPGAPGLYEIRWTIRDAAGTELGGETQRLTLSSDDVPAPAVLAGPMHSLAPKLAALIQDSAPTEHQPTRHLLIRDIDGAPGDGAKSLKRSLIYLLKQNGIPLTEDPNAPDTVAVACAIETKPGSGNLDHIKIHWRILKPDGSEAGVVNQENDVPHAMINAQWGDLAMAVASAAAPDLLRVAGTVPQG